VSISSRIALCTAAAAAVFATVVCGAPAFAATVSPAPTFNIQVTIASTCAISTAPSTIDFGTPSKPLNDTSYVSSPISGSTSFALTCTSGVTPSSLALSWGANASASPRKMANGANRISYDLYSDSGYTTVWTPSSGGPSISTGSGTPQTYTIYAKITDTVTPPAGTYTDTVTLTVTY